jgi:uncharacterized membrane protein
MCIFVKPPKDDDVFTVIGCILSVIIAIVSVVAVIYNTILIIIRS